MSISHARLDQFSIFGAISIVAPLALRMAMPARRLNYVAYACAVVGLMGMVGTVPETWMRFGSIDEARAGAKLM